MERIDIYAVVQKIVGDTSPVGETNTDNMRFENLEDMIGLVGSLIGDIADVARFNKDRQEYSMSRAGEKAHSFLLSHGIEDY